MNNHGIHYWGANSFPNDGVGARDDLRRPYKSDWVASGKILRPDHYKMPVGSYSVDETIATLLDALNDVMVSKPTIHYQLGCAYKKKGDVEQAKKHFELAAKVGHSDAKSELDEILGVKREVKVAVANPQINAHRIEPELPKVKYFKVTEIVLENGVSGYLLQVDLGNRKGLQPISAAVRQIGLCSSDVFHSRQQAYDIGMRVKEKGLRSI